MKACWCHARGVLAFLAMSAGVLTPIETAAQQLTLQVVPRTVTFHGADPDSTPQVIAPAIEIRIRIRRSGGSPWSLSVLADGDLVAGPASVDISNVSWTGTPSPPFQSGTLSQTVWQTVAAGTGDVNPALRGSVVFRLVNSWDYAAGNYSQTIVFTLSVP